MASLSDQIDRLTRNTRAIKSTASQTAQKSSSLGTFTRAVLNTPLGDLIRDIDPSELGLFSLVQDPSNNPYDKDSRTTQDPEVKRIEFAGATPLRKHQSRREDKQEIEPEVYAHAALKYIDQYEPIRPMPRAYDQIASILERLNTVREHIESLHIILKQTSIIDEAPSLKTRAEQEEYRIQDLQARIAELSKKKERTTRKEKPKTARRKVQQTDPPKEQSSAPISPSSPQEDKFWATPGEPSRILRFADNLLDEEANLGDISTASFGSPLAGASGFRQPGAFAEAAFSSDENILAQLTASKNILKQDVRARTENENQDQQVERVSTPAAILAIPPETEMLTPQSASSNIAEPNEPPNKKSAATPNARQRRIKVNLEVERIASKIWSTISDIIVPPRIASTTDPLSVSETITHLQYLAAQTPQPESPIASSASSISAAEGGSPPTFQQILTAYLLIMLLSSSPYYSMPLNQVKENLALKARSSGVSTAGQGTTRILYGCVAKRLVKIDRGGREQVVKFDI